MYRPETEESINSLLASLTQTCTELFLRLEQPSILDPLGPRDCLDLLSTLGQLGHDNSFESFPTLRDKRDVQYKTLQSRFFKLLATHLSQLLTCLDKGILQELSRIEGAARNVENDLEKNRLQKSYTSFELNALLLNPRDQIGYAQLAMNDIGANMSPSFLNEIQATDNRLREFLPVAVLEIRGAGDDPTPEPGSFPESFWWRHL